MNWRTEADCYVNGADPILFEASDHPNGKVPAPAKQAIGLYCSHCPVIDECRAFGDQTQSTGVFGGQYRDLVKARYRVHGDRDELYVSGIHVRGDSLEGPQPIPLNTISSGDAMRLLGMNVRPSLGKACIKYGVVPVMEGSGPRPSYYLRSDIEYMRSQRAV